MRYSNTVLAIEGHAGPHPSEDELEEFVFGRLEGDELDRLEEHLLACNACRKRLTETENFVASTRAATRQMLGAPAPTPKTRRFSAPAVALAGALAVLLLAIGYSLAPRNATAQEVTLVAERGPAPNIAFAGQPMNLKLDVNGLPAFRWLEIVDGQGQRLYSAPVAPPGAGILLHQAPALPKGQTWIRLHAQPSPAPAVLPLREFNLLLQ
ncbi:MAG: zf-HC2 domain-containing protein [Bryobacteraceae bacterium]|nr:zf-HC2 domain-containing protein [Bryobacteraceae bacterium]